MASIAPVAIGAGAQLAGGAIGYFGGKSAQRSQERAAREALQYQRERDQQLDAQFQQELELRQQASALDRARFQADAPRRLAAASVAARYGIQVPTSVVSGLNFGSGPDVQSSGPGISARYRTLAPLMGGESPFEGQIWTQRSRGLGGLMPSGLMRRTSDVE